MNLGKQLYIEHGKISTDSLIPLIREIEDKPEYWKDNTRPKNNPSQKYTENLIFVWTPILDMQEFSVYTNTTLLSTPIGKAYQEITKQVLQLVPGTVLRGAIIRLPPKKGIASHLDGIHEIWTRGHRLHLPVITEPEVKFFYTENDIETNAKHLAKDILVEINNFLPHGVRHDGNYLRYHVMYDILDIKYNGPFIVNNHSDSEILRIDREIEVYDNPKFHPKFHL